MIQYKPLKWGLTNLEWNKRWPGLWKQTIISVDWQYSVEISDCIILSNVYGDCGALNMYGASYATDERLKLVEDIASNNGFNKIFATLVGNKVNMENKIKAFKKARWILVKKGISNRKQSSDVIDYVYVKYISNCKYKGYYGNE